MLVSPTVNPDAAPSLDSVLALKQSPFFTPLSVFRQILACFSGIAWKISRTRIFLQKKAKIW